MVYHHKCARFVPRTYPHLLSKWWCAINCEDSLLSANAHGRNPSVICLTLNLLCRYFPCILAVGRDQSNLVHAGYRRRAQVVKALDQRWFYLLAFMQRSYLHCFLMSLFCQPQQQNITYLLDNIEQSPQSFYCISL